MLPTLKALMVETPVVTSRVWRSRRCKSSLALLWYVNDAYAPIRCFLFLVNYARMKPDVAVKAIPVLELVSSFVNLLSWLH